MKLKELLKDINYEIISGNENCEIGNITWDSRNVCKNALFIAVKNVKVDRHDFIAEAVKQGAIAVVLEHNVIDIPKNITVIKVENSRRAMALIAKNFYHNPMEKLTVVGITGTSGKTSVSCYISKILEANSKKCGIIGTIENTVNGQKLKTKKLNPTTPDSIELQGSLAEIAEQGASHVAMEVTSSALIDDRVYGCTFHVGVFTNLTQDHLDVHGTMENYKKAKMKLFKMCKIGTINIDDPSAMDFIASSDCDLYTYGINHPCDFRAEDIKYTNNCVYFNLKHNGETRKVELNIPGKFSVYNALAAISACSLLGLTLDEIIYGISKISGVPGRFQAIPNQNNVLTIIDYAHTPNEIENILLSVKEISKGRIISVFGCGGNRDRSKRSIMGEIAGRYSDYCVITSDNPRDEEPMQIINDIEKGTIKTNCSYEKLADRKQAIWKALQLAKTGDSVVIAGKGHENYQILKKETIHFSDEEVVQEYFSSN